MSADVHFVFGYDLDGAVGGDVDDPAAHQMPVGNSTRIWSPRLHPGSGSSTKVRTRHRPTDVPLPGHNLVGLTRDHVLMPARSIQRRPGLAEQGGGDPRRGGAAIPRRAACRF
jgi:hypothetical protein